MNAKLFFILAFFPLFLFGQEEKTRHSPVSITMGFDYSCNLPDKVLTWGMDRKLTLGLSFTDKKRKYIGYLVGGLKAAKFNLFSPLLQPAFVKDVQQNYVPIAGLGEDSLIAAKMYSSPGHDFWGTYSQYFQAGFIFNNKWRPGISFYTGNEEFLLSDNAFLAYEDDVEYVGMSTRFYELKAGFALPFKMDPNKPYSFNLNLGYKFIDYKDLKFSNTPLGLYTNGALQDKYRHSGRITLSFSCMFWLNW